MQYELNFTLSASIGTKTKAGKILVLAGAAGGSSEWWLSDVQARFAHLPRWHLSQSPQQISPSTHAPLFTKKGLLACPQEEQLAQSPEPCQKAARGENPPPYGPGQAQQISSEHTESMSLRNAYSHPSGEAGHTSCRLLVSSALLSNAASRVCSPGTRAAQVQSGAACLPLPCCAASRAAGPPLPPAASSQSVTPEMRPHLSPAVVWGLLTAGRPGPQC